MILKGWLWVNEVVYGEYCLFTQLPASIKLAPSDHLMTMVVVGVDTGVIPLPPTHWAIQWASAPYAVTQRAGAVVLAEGYGGGSWSPAQNGLLLLDLEPEKKPKRKAVRIYAE